ncbi:MAG: hypothetical protein LBU22_12275 [Dysgonamonadaceae bacterium]|jgi:hypothetical protein|nr:hypothetical protein [Dysgonamonadaceae bacterium]
MNIDKIHKAFVSGRLLLLCTLLGFVALRVYDVGGDWRNPHCWVSTFIQIGIALLLLQLNHVFNIIRSRTLLPAIFYLVFASSDASFAFDSAGSISAFCVLINYFFLFNSYQQAESQINALNISLSLTLGSLFWPQLLLFFPVFWYGFHRFHSFNLRVFMASIIGVLAVYLFIVTWCVYAGDWHIFFSAIPEPDKCLSIQIPDFTVLNWMVIGFTFLICLMTGFNLFGSGLSEKIRTVSILNYLYISSFIILIPFLLQSESQTSWSLIIWIPVTILISHLFTLSNRKYIKYMMLFFFFFLLGMSFLQHFYPQHFSFSGRPWYTFYTETGL